MPVRDLCRRAAVTIDHGATLAEAALQMREHQVGALVVTSEEGGAHRVSGIVTDRDLALDGLAPAPGTQPLRVGDIARHKLVAVRANAEPAQAAQLMQQHGVRRLLVVDAEGRLGGVISIDDLIEVMALQLGALSGALRGGAVLEAGPAQPWPASGTTPPGQHPAQHLAQHLAQHPDPHAPPRPAAPARVVFLPMGTPGMH
jgi:CBS domain-containing protein